ncbi:MAG: T9SS type A sorting domain-containing protein, partial [Phycisphaerae bacterium]|nr:T9SS type A sorting domain-containing protein [Phycisphaerae bacterium]
MFRIIVSLLLFTAASWGSGSTADNPDGEVIIEEGFGSILSEDLAYPDCPPSSGGLMSPLEGVLPPVRDNEYSGPAWGGYDWGSDHLVYDSPSGVGSSQDFDYDPNTGYIYATLDTYHSTNDSVIVYRSTDNGATWSRWQVSYYPEGSMDNARIRVATTGGVTYICNMMRQNTAAADILWTRRWHADGSGSTWEQVAADVDRADMDADIGTSAYMYATWVPAGTNDVYAARNALAGAGWVNTASLYSNTETAPYPAIAAGTGGVVSVAFNDTRLTTYEQVRIKRSTNYGSSWLGSEQVSNNTGGFDLSSFDLAHARGSSAWVTLMFDVSGDWNFGYYFSTNSGVDWTYGGLFSGEGDEWAGSIRARKTLGDLTLAYNTDPGDIVNFTWANASDPDNFTDPIQINDEAAVNWGPTAGWAGSYSAVLYTRTDYSLWFDSWNNTGISDGDVSSVSGIGVSPNPFRDVATISFSLDNGGPVSIEVFDMSGRLVTTLAEGSSFASGSHQVTWNGTASGAPVPGGVYICRMTSQGSTQSARMVL